MLVMSLSERFPTGKPLTSVPDIASAPAEAYPWSLRGLVEFTIPDDVMSLVDGSAVYDHVRQIAVDRTTGQPAAANAPAMSLRSYSSSVPEDTLPDVVQDASR